jgi:hypothetical protein
MGALHSLTPHIPGLAQGYHTVRLIVNTNSLLFLEEKSNLSYYRILRLTLKVFESGPRALPQGF